MNYLHTQGTIGLDSRTSPGYTRRGVFLGATLHDYRDSDKVFGFQFAEYEGIAHLPILRETWVLSFHGRVQSAFDKDGQQTPFFICRRSAAARRCAASAAGASATRTAC